MDVISLYTPENLTEEHQKFLADQSYNPQFRYTKEFTPENLQRWGMPQKALVDHSLQMIKTIPIKEETGPFITREEIQAQIDDFNTYYHLEYPIKTFFSQDAAVRCRVTDVEIFFQLPIRYTAETFADLYRHELETHILRRLNHTEPIWKKIKANGPLFRRTEEGLADLHSHLLREDKIMIKTCLAYYAVYLAQSMSFVDMYRTLQKLGQPERRCWNLTVRTKRGVTDTSQPGGVTKDICYFEGAILVWDWIVNKHHDPRDLYLGRLNLAQIEEYQKVAQHHAQHYPRFMNDTAEYLHNISEIAEVNHFARLAQEITL